MTPKEKAKDLVHKYYNEINPDAPDCNISFNQCKQCALISVNEILNEYWSHDTKRRDWWKEVKQEILKI